MNPITTIAAVKSCLLSSYIVVINQWFCTEKCTYFRFQDIDRFIMKQIIDRANLTGYINKIYIGNIIQKR